jgi:hypothetical protein
MLRLLFIVSVLFVCLDSVERCQGEAPMSVENGLFAKGAQTTASKLFAFMNLPIAAPREEAVSQWYDRMSEEQVKFLELLNTLNAQVSDQQAQRIENFEPAGLSINLVHIARDYSNHPAHFDEIAQTYRMQPRTARTPQVQRPTTLVKTQAIEEYRAAWELLLVAPLTINSRFIRERCFEAIAAIRNNTSIPVLVFLFQRANASLQDPIQAQQVEQEQLRVLQTLNLFCNMQSLHAMIQCIKISEDNADRKPQIGGYPVRTKVVRYLLDQEQYGNGKEWRKIIETALDGKLSDADRTFLKDVLKMPESK